MKKEKKTFVMSLDWWDDIEAMSQTERGWFLESIYRYQLFGEVPENADRFMMSKFNEARRFFDINNVKYAERCIQSKLAQQKRWAEEKGNAEMIRLIDEQSRFLKSHSLQEYTDKYGSIRTYTDNDNDSDNENESDYDSDNVYDNESDYDSDNESDYVSDSDSGDGVQRKRSIVSLEELLTYCEEHQYTFDARKAYRAKALPLYKDELKESCDTWEALQKI